jgi:hypothetical protein
MANWHQWDMHEEAKRSKPCTLQFAGPATNKQKSCVMYVCYKTVSSQPKANQGMTAAGTSQGTSSQHQIGGLEISLMMQQEQRECTCMCHAVAATAPTCKACIIHLSIHTGCALLVVSEGHHVLWHLWGAGASSGSSAAQRQRQPGSRDTRNVLNLCSQQSWLQQTVHSTHEHSKTLATQHMHGTQLCKPGESS